MDDDLSTANAVAAVCGLTGHLGIDGSGSGVNPDDQAAVAALAAAATMESFSQSMLSQAAAVAATTTPPPRKKQRHRIHQHRDSGVGADLELPGIPLPKGVQRSRKAFVGGFCSKGRRFSGPTRKTVEEALSDRLRLEQLGGDIAALEALSAELRAEVDDGDGRRSRGRKRQDNGISVEHHHHGGLPNSPTLLKMRRDALQSQQAAEAAAAAAALCGVGPEGAGETLHTPAAQHLPEGVMLISIGGLGNAFVAYQRAPTADRIHILGPPRRTIVAAGDDYQAAIGLTSPPTTTRGNRPINESILICSGIGRVVSLISEDELTSAYVGIIIVSGESCYPVGPIRETTTEAKNDLDNAGGGILTASVKAIPQPHDEPHMLDFGEPQVVDIDVHSGEDDHRGEGSDPTVSSGLDSEWV
ncbi:hypothetical protein Pmar_PMAR022068 [Perkinsus marinus ATCC 50983]|uniref:Uncharacterized protein n=1 Tax=Perkinsus marinus (strain ATCC 50983 / TXsc) TaxID=423536 RepID=C5KKU2_PERM5|nr:hypothetical protein Pmar_PMAR022068 [Perkinsus marinus ATCC 50983]EER14903.1 hypothetical protein Pmar_PMAR022068 [Perkinsus marinus ATCC 50983]|eukprot:XP_002783107.1 hypothetical protein Pmar_PMAR022068 [Perkinsus marinus ATCC 50983]